MKTLFLAAALVAIIGLSGCASTGKLGKSIQNEFGGGLNRRVTFYSLDGKAVRTWEGKIFTEGNEGGALFFQVNGKRITASGTYVIEEL